MSDRIRTNIGFLGVDLRPLDRQRPDGVCELIHNLRPSGLIEKPTWRPVKLRGALTDSESEPSQSSSGSIEITSSASADGGIPASTYIDVLTSAASTPSKAVLMLASSPTGTGSFFVELTNLPNGSGSYEVDYYESEPPNIIMSRVADVLSADAGVLVDLSIEYLSASNPSNNYGGAAVVLTSIATGLSTNSYNVHISYGFDVHLSVVINGGDSNNFSGGSTTGGSFRVNIDGLLSSWITIESNKNTPDGIESYIRDAINNSIFGWSAYKVTIDGNEKVFVYSTRASNQELDNGKSVSITGDHTFTIDSIANTAGGQGGESGTGITTITLPEQNITVQTEVINAGESPENIKTKIQAALNGHGPFTAIYEINSVSGSKFEIESKLPGATYNSSILINSSGRYYTYMISNIGGGSDSINTNVIASHWYKRIRRGDQSIDNTGSLNRLIILQNNRLAIVDPEKNYSVTVAYNLSNNSNRRASFRQVDDILLISLSIGDNPEKTLILIDDTFFPFRMPSLPELFITGEEKYYQIPKEDLQGLDPGNYCFRAAWRFKDGSTSALGQPFLKSLPSPNPPSQYSNPDLWRLGYKTIVKAALPLPSSEFQQRELFKDIVDGIALFMSTGSTMSDAINGIFYDVGTMSIDTISEEIERRTESIYTLPVADESNLFGIHEIASAISYSYNKRFILGNTSINFNKPYVSPRNLGGGSPMAFKNIRFVVGIESGGSIIKRFSDENVQYWDKIYADSGMIPFQLLGSTLISYPSRRAQWVEAWAEFDGVWKRLLFNDFQWNELTNDYDPITPIARPRLSAARSANFAYLSGTGYWSIPENSPIYPSGIDDIDFYDMGDDQVFEKVKNRIYASSPYNPFHIPARQTYFAQSDPDDPITAFASNSMPISSGQFGQYPVFVFTRKSISALEQIADPLVAFGRINSVSTRMGTNSPHSVINVGRLVFFIADDGLYSLPNDTNTPISEPISVALTPFLNNATLGYFQQGDIKEVWVSSPSTGAKTWCYSMKFNRWFSIDGRSKMFFDDGERLFSINHEGTMQEESITAGTVYGSIHTGHMNFSEPDLKKRITNLIIKMRSTATEHPLIKLYGDGYQLLPANYRTPHVRTKYGAMNEFKLEIEGSFDPGDWIESFDISLQPRYEHRRV